MLANPVMAARLETLEAAATVLHLNRPLMPPGAPDTEVNLSKIRLLVQRAKAKGAVLSSVERMDQVLATMPDGATADQVADLDQRWRSLKAGLASWEAAELAELEELPKLEEGKKLASTWLCKYGAMLERAPAADQRQPGSAADGGEGGGQRPQQSRQGPVGTPVASGCKTVGNKRLREGEAAADAPEPASVRRRVNQGTEGLSAGAPLSNA